MFRNVIKAAHILRNHGLSRFLKALRAHLSLRDSPAAPNEASLVFNVLNAGGHTGTMVDVGAHLGGSLAPFARSGWRVIAFEPDSENRSKLLNEFGHLANVIVDPRGLSNSVSEGATLYKSKVSSGISGLSAFHHTHVAGETIDVTTLELACREHRISRIDFLKIDTEGFDLFVLKGLAWNALSPLFILCEFEDAKTVPLGYTFHDLADYLVSLEYRLIVSEWYPIERYGEQHSWRCFNTYPCQLQDSRAWGNIFAVREADHYTALLSVCRAYSRE